MSELILTVEQKQCLSQKTIQNIEILQMNAQELDAFLNKLALENPAIEWESDSLSKEDVQMDVEYSTEDYYIPSRKQHSTHETQNNALEQMLADPVNSLSEHIMFQLIPHFHNAKDKSVLYYLVESLDGNGFLTVTTSTLCDVFNISEDSAKHYIALLQSVEPAGIGATNLTECLLLQIRRSQQCDTELAEEIISHHLDKLANNQLKQLAKFLNVSIQDVTSVLKIIKTLNPRPANGFCCNELASYIQPDVIILQKHNHFQITINGTLAPGFKINNNYRSLLNHPDQEVREYLYQKFQQADWINKCLEQRNSTLLRVTRQILLNQKAFFLKGPDYLKPLSQASISKQLELHDSTISRAIHDKYLECFWGVFPFKYFFSKGVMNIDNEMTVENLKKLIKSLIDAEDKAHPLSDQKLVNLLNARGITVARRTVAKYRNEMMIPDTSRRRKM